MLALRTRATAMSSVPGTSACADLVSCSAASSTPRLRKAASCDARRNQAVTFPGHHVVKAAKLAAPTNCTCRHAPVAAAAPGPQLPPAAPLPVAAPAVPARPAKHRGDLRLTPVLRTGSLPHGKSACFSRSPSATHKLQAAIPTCALSSLHLSCSSTASLTDSSRDSSRRMYALSAAAPPCATERTAGCACVASPCRCLCS